MTSTITSIVDYSRGLSRSLSKPSIQKASSISSSLSEAAPPLQKSTSLEQVPTSNPVQKAAHFSPEHLEYVAYKMASKKLPMTADRARAKRTYSWSPVKRSGTGMLHPKDKKIEHHGRLYDASQETGHFAYAMGATALKVPVSLFYNLANLISCMTPLFAGEITSLVSAPVLKWRGKKSCMAFMTVWLGWFFIPITDLSPLPLPPPPALNH
jgi:hypothetical protein